MEGLESELDNVILKSADHLINSGPAEADIGDNKDANEIGLSLHEQLVFYEGYEQDVSDMEIINEEIDDLRKDIVQTSYS